ncbi:FGGY-family carbohydrate kinase [Persicobacter psychrovividus]|uniref:Carbohydrate kinase FGGY N-terminal domain-containing protein n=1 Tax=Persicobacter psychrovividus TaxID=387638 RepID=A0ABM7VDU5_9BACT|nr:hypothetical protein PEPS_13960 [Persicobacter psychrovividus]
MSKSVIAIFDIGRTYKKFFLFDRNYEIVHEEVTRFDDIVDEDGDTCEDLAAIVEWVKRTFKESMKMKEFQIRALNFTSYGASWVHINKAGKPVTPVYSYWKPIPQGIKEQFYKKYGDVDKFSLETSSPQHGLLNAGMQLYWLKHDKPDLYKKIHTSLGIPQYLSYVITGKAFSEITHLGCHSSLWDYKKDRSHDWVYKEKLYSKFPPIVNTTSCERIIVKNREVKVGIGITGSAASMVPYQLGFERNYIVLTTGTWSTATNPGNQSKITLEDIDNDNFDLLSFRGDTMRTSRIFLGKEHEFHLQRIASHWNLDRSFYKNVPVDQEMIRVLMDKLSPERRFFPQSKLGSRFSPDEDLPLNDLDQFNLPECAYHQLILDLSCLQASAIESVIGESEVGKVFVAGGFSYNDNFKRILPAILPDIQFYTNGVNRATALGAALALHTHWNKETNLDNLLQFEMINEFDIPELEGLALL